MTNVKDALARYDRLMGAGQATASTPEAAPERSEAGVRLEGARFDTVKLANGRQVRLYAKNVVMPFEVSDTDSDV